MKRHLGPIIGLFVTLSLVACTRNREKPATSAGDAPSGPAAATPKKTEAPRPAATVKYYYGKVLTTSPDGKTPYGPPRFSLAKRTVDQATGTVMEVVRNGGKTFNTTLTRPAKGLAWTAADAEGTFSGTVTFADASLGAWTYDIVMKNGSGSIKGRGSVDAGGLKTEKVFSDPKGTPRARITEDLREISEQEYKKLLTGPAAPAPASGK